MAVRKIFIVEISRTTMYTYNRARAHAGTNTSDESAACEIGGNARAYVAACVRCVRALPFSSRAAVMPPYRRHIDLPFRRAIFSLSRVALSLSLTARRDARIAYFGAFK